MLALILLRSAELEILVGLGVYKNVENMSDKEMFSEYDKLKKQSLKLQKRIKRNGGLGSRRKTHKSGRDSTYSEGESSVDDNSISYKSKGEEVERKGSSNNNFTNTRDSVQSI